MSKNPSPGAQRWFERQKRQRNYEKISEAVARDLIERNKKRDDYRKRKGK